MRVKFVEKILDRFLWHKAIHVLKNKGVYALFLGGLQYLFRDVYLALFANKVLREINEFNSDSPKEVFDYAYWRHMTAFRPIQARDEFLELLEIYKNLKPKVVLEIGTANGGSLFCFTKLAPTDCIIISIDLPPEKSLQSYSLRKKRFLNSFVREKQMLYLIWGDSHSVKTLEEVRSILKGKSVDFLFIDGDHSYEGVKLDFEMYGPLVRKGGIIVFHDINGNKDGCVPKFWHELKQSGSYSVKEIIKREGTPYGIGLLYK